MDDSIVEAIYECAFASDKWPAVLDKISTIVDAPGGVLIIKFANSYRWTSSQSIREPFDLQMREGWLERGRFLSRAMSASLAKFTTDDDYFSEEEMREEPIYRDFYFPLGFAYGVATAFALTTGEKVVFGWRRLTERGCVEATILDQLNIIRPHLARASVIAARLQLERAKAASQTLAALRLPAIVINATGKVIVANSLVEELEEFIGWRSENRFILKDKAANRILGEAIEALPLGATHGVRSMPVRNQDGSLQLVAHLVPICLTAKDIFSDSAAVLLLTPIKAPNVPPIDLVRSLFDLTGMEAHVAVRIASGETVEDIATSSNVAPSTIRTHVRGILGKTGCSRQAEIVSLLSRVSSVPLPQPK